MKKPTPEILEKQTEIINLSETLRDLEGGPSKWRWRGALWSLPIGYITGFAAAAANKIWVADLFDMTVTRGGQLTILNTVAGLTAVGILGLTFSKASSIGKEIKTLDAQHDEAEKAYQTLWDALPDIPEPPVTETQMTVSAKKSYNNDDNRRRRRRSEASSPSSSGSFGFTGGGFAAPPTI